MRKLNSNKSMDTSTSTLPEQLHSKMDGKARYHRLNNDMPQYISIPQQSAYISNANGRITSKEKYFMENMWPTKTLELYYMKRWRCTICIPQASSNTKYSVPSRSTSID